MQARNGLKPYEKPSSAKPDAKVDDITRGPSSRWSALSSEVIQDESGWDVVYSDGACKGNGKVGSTAGVGVWWGVNDKRYGARSISHTSLTFTCRNIAERCPGSQTNNRAELIVRIPRFLRLFSR